MSIPLVYPRHYKLQLTALEARMLLATGPTTLQLVSNYSPTEENPED
jgi:hypothetical protein